MKIRSLFTRLIVLLLLLFLPGSLFPESVPRLEKKKGSMFWKIQGENCTVYILGTLHGSSENILNLDKEILNCFDNSELYYSELSKSLAENLMAFPMDYIGDFFEPVYQIPGEFSHNENKLISKIIGEDVYRKYSSFHPFLLYTLLSGKKENKGENIYSVDKFLIDRLGNKDYQGLDTEESFKDSLCPGSFDDYIALIKEFLKKYPDFKEEEELEKDLISAYLEGNCRKFSGILDKIYTPENNDLTEYYKSFNEKVLSARNRLWADKIKIVLNGDKDVFIFAGAAHFCGRNSVFEILANEGILVIPAGQ